MMRSAVVLPLIRVVGNDPDFFASSGLDPCCHVILIVTEKRYGH